jgi:c-di-AMP phosphodiesterase-like protein
LTEIKKLIETDESKSTKRKKLIEKIESFGKDIATNILANILINPNIWG